ncbi:MAG: hypothetical protein IJ695_09575 [Butyrivibrio sp.]|nr:hypothetical protein [Butyrivibrio sp.]
MERNKENHMALVMSGLFGIISSAFLIFGYQLETQDYIDVLSGNTPFFFAAFIFVITLDTYHVWRNYDSTDSGGRLFGFIKLPKWEKRVSVSKREFRINFAILSLLTLPVFLGEFPGFFVYDAQEELNEVLTRSFTTHHPLLHVLLMGGTVALFHKISGSWNIGIAAYILLQMLVISLILSYIVTMLMKSGIGKRARFLFVIYYGVFPPIVMYSLCSCKDGLFSALLLLLTALLIELVRDPEGFIGSRIKVFAFVLTATLMPCFRHNGFYAYLVFVPFALIYFRKRLKSLLPVMLVVPVVLYLVLSQALSVICHAAGTHHQEMLTVPIMQIARVYAYENGSISGEDREVITAYIPEEDLMKYTPRVSDLVKVNFNNDLYEKNSADFWKVWYRLFLQHPLAYINAWMLTSYGYYYPPAIINVYRGNTVYTFTYDVSSYFGYEVEPPGVRTSFIKPIDDLYRYISIGSFQQDMPILHLFFSPGLYVFIYMFVFAYRLSKKRIGGVLPFLPMILTFCTVLLGPTYLIRYVLYLWLCLPLLVITGNRSFKFE